MPADAEARRRSRASKTRVVLFDRSDAARAGLVGLLKRRKALDVMAAPPDLVQAGEMIAAEQPDVVLVDTHYGDTDAVTVCRHFRLASEAPLVLLVSFMTDERWMDLRSAGADAYLLKRVDSAALERDLVALAGSPRNGAIPGASP